MRGSRTLLILAACVLCGCPSTSVYRTADPVSKGAWRVGGALGAGVIVDSEQESKLPTGDMELHVRRGVSKNVDVGAKLFVAGTEVNATWRVSRSVWSFAVAPSLSGLHANESAVLPESIHVFAGLTGIASRPLSKRWSIAVGPSSGWGLYLPSTGGHAQGLWLGSFAHGQFRVGDHWLMGPEVTMYRVVSGQVPVRGGSLQLGFGLSRGL